MSTLARQFSQSRLYFAYFALLYVATDVAACMMHVMVMSLFWITNLVLLFMSVVIKFHFVLSHEPQLYMVKLCISFDFGNMCMFVMSSLASGTNYLIISFTAVKILVQLGSLYAAWRYNETANQLLHQYHQPMLIDAERMILDPLDPLDTEEVPVFTTVPVEKIVKDKCSVCLEDLSAETTVIQLLECEHQFHKDCMHSWVAACEDNGNYVSCPNCRR